MGAAFILRLVLFSPRAFLWYPRLSVLQVPDALRTELRATLRLVGPVVAV